MQSTMTSKAEYEGNLILTNNLFRTSKSDVLYLWQKWEILANRFSRIFSSLCVSVRATVPFVWKGSAQSPGLKFQQKKNNLQTYRPVPDLPNVNCHLTPVTLCSGCLGGQKLCEFNQGFSHFKGFGKSCVTLTHTQAKTDPPERKSSGLSEEPPERERVLI